MKFNYLWYLLLSIILCYSCKKDTTNDLESLPNYYFGKYHPSCGFAPPCSDIFWLINQAGLVQFGNMPGNIFTLQDSLGQVSENLLNNPIIQVGPIPNELAFEGMGSIINQASAINSSCYTFENATAVPNAINYFVLIPLADNRFQMVNLNTCQDRLPLEEKQNIDNIIDWLKMIDEQLGG